MERFDVFVIGGGGTGSEVAFRLGERGMRVAIAERDKLGGECNHYGCVPTKAMLAQREDRGARPGRRPVRRPDPVGRRWTSPPSSSASADVIDAQSGEGAGRSSEAGIRVFLRRPPDRSALALELATERRSRPTASC